MRLGATAARATKEQDSSQCPDVERIEEQSFKYVDSALCAEYVHVTPKIYVALLM